jgi:hypothetical protein
MDGIVEAMPFWYGLCESDAFDGELSITTSAYRSSTQARSRVLFSTASASCAG